MTLLPVALAFLGGYLTAWALGIKDRDTARRLAVMVALKDHPDRWWYTRDIVAATGVSWGRAVTILIGFEDDGVIVGRWDDPWAHGEGRRTRRAWKLHRPVSNDS